MEAACRYFVVDRFSPDADKLRAAFERRFSERLSPFDPARFVWEYWHVPGQFAQQRTPARTFFPEPLIARFELRLLAWATANLGLSQLGGPPWLSYLVDGQFQALHRDSPNGEFAFSFGLTKPTPPRFFGGETQIARPELLDYWRAGAFRPEVAHTPLFDEIPPRFNRLVVFDSRVPHGVRLVQGTREPIEGRVAIQGWLRASGCAVVSGGLDKGEAAQCLDPTLGRVTKGRGVEGLLTVRLDITDRGRVRSTSVIVNTLVATAQGADVGTTTDALIEAVSKARFPEGKGPSRVIVPILIPPSGRAAIPQ